MAVQPLRRCLLCCQKLGQQRIKLALGLGHRAGKYFTADFLALDGDLMNLIDAYKIEHSNECGFQVIERL